MNLFLVKLNQNLDKYLTFANTDHTPALACQGDLNKAIFFTSEESAEKAIEAYLSHPSCKMTIANRKFISIESIEATDTFNKFPFTTKVSYNNDTLVCVYINYNGFTDFGFVSLNTYSSL